jgi:molybdopterin-guanine dinucleotide biosynthesis protein A
VTRFGAVVLTGGASRRMGTDKAFVELDGQPLAARALDVMQRAGATRVVAVGGDLERLAGLGFAVLADRHPGEGPLGGLVDGLDDLAVVDAECGLGFVMACDQVAIDERLPGRLAAHLTTADLDAALAVVDDVRQPLGAVYRVEARQLLRAAFAGGERSIRRAVEQLRVVEVRDVPASWFADVDTPGDLDHYAASDDRS